MNTKRILFVVIPEKGHLSVPIGVAQRLERMGHELRYFCHQDVSAAIAAAGLKGKVTMPAEVFPPQRKGGIRANDVKWLARFFELCVRQILAPGIIDRLAAVVDEFKPDVLCVDPIAYHAIAVAESRKIPWAGVASTLVQLAPEDWSSFMTQAHDVFASRRAALFASHGIHHPVSVFEVVSPWLNIVFTTEAFAPVHDHDAHAIRVGPVRHLGGRGDEVPFPWERIRPDVPLVYASFGGGDALAFPEHAFPKIFGALEPGEAQFVTPLHHLCDAPFTKELPRHVIAVRYAPQVAILERAAAVVTHGGANTVMECLSAARPMLVVPIGHEQPLQATLVERAGVGFKLSLEGLTAAQCRERLLALLDPDGPQRGRSREIAASYAASDGAERAAELVVELATTQAPISR